MFNWIFNIIANPIFNDVPEPLQLGFQDGASPGYSGIVDLHDSIFFYLVLISVGVFWMLGSVLLNFSIKSNPITYKYATHGTLIELIWTITPAFILIAIAFPSFKLLYMLDLIAGNILIYNMSTLVVTKPNRSTISIKDIKNNSNVKSIIIYGNMPYTESSIGIRLNNYIRSITKPTTLQLYEMIGHLLGDGSLEMCKTSKYPRFCFTQTFQRFDYTWSVYQNFSNLCQKLPSYNRGLRKEKYHYSLVIHTRSYPFFNGIIQLVLSFSKWKKN